MATKSAYKIPPREWYTLRQAVNRIYKLTGEKLDISDLHHYWLIGKLNLRMPFFYSKGECYIGDTELNVKEIKIEQNGKNVADSFYYKNDYCKINKQGEILEKLEIDGYFSTDLIFNYALQREKSPSSFHNYEFIRLDEHIKLHTLKEVKENSKVFYENDVTLDINITYRKNSRPRADLINLVITEQDLIDFLQSEEKNITYRRKDLPNKFKKEISNNEIKPNARREQSMFNFIKILLDIHYGITKGNEARKAMDDGKLGYQIDNYKVEKRIECIKGQTLGVWYDTFN